MKTVGVDRPGIRCAIAEAQCCRIHPQCLRIVPDGGVGIPHAERTTVEIDTLMANTDCIINTLGKTGKRPTEEKNQEYPHHTAIPPRYHVTFSRNGTTLCRTALQDTHFIGKEPFFPPARLPSPPQARQAVQESEPLIADLDESQGYTSNSAVGAFG